MPPFELLETLLWRPGHGYALLARHLRRMSDSAEYFGFKYSRAQALARLRAAAGKFPAHSQRVRLLLNRVGTIRIEYAGLQGGTGFQPVQAPAGGRCHSKAATTWKVALAKKPVNSSDLFLFHKTTRRAVYEAALRQHPNCDDALLFNERGELTESCFANIVVVRRGRWLTPPLACGLLAGTQRAELLARGKLIERTLRVDELKKSDQILLINSVRGIIETSSRDK